MNLPDGLLGTSWLWASWLLFLPLLGYALYRAPWHTLKDEARLHQLLGACVLLLGIWSIKTGIKPGLNFHLLGVTALTLMFGPYLALFAVTLVLAGATLAGMSGYGSFASNVLSMGVVPLLFTYTLFRWVDQKLPNHLFVYIFANGFWGAGLSMLAAGLVSTLVLGLSTPYSWEYLRGNYLPYYILLGWSEALLTGMAMTLLTVFRPKWVATFDDARYIHNK